MYNGTDPREPSKERTGMTLCKSCKICKSYKLLQCIQTCLQHVAKVLQPICSAFKRVRNAECDSNAFERIRTDSNAIKQIQTRLKGFEHV